MTFSSEPFKPSVKMGQNDVTLKVLPPIVFVISKQKGSFPEGFQALDQTGSASHPGMKGTDTLHGYHGVMRCLDFQSSKSRLLPAQCRSAA